MLAWKRGDTAPTPTVQLIDRDGQPADLTGATVVMQVRDRPGIACTVVDAEAGKVRPGRGDLEPEGSRLLRVPVEFEVTFSSGQVQTFPETAPENLTVWPDLDEAS